MALNNNSSTGRTIFQVYGGTPKKRGSLEEYFLYLSSRLHREGYRCVFVFNSDIDAPLKQYYEETGAEIVVLSETHKRFDLSMIKRFYRLFHQRSPELVNFHFGSSCPNGLLAARLAGVKHTVWTKHSFYQNGPFYRELPPWKRVGSMILLQGILARRLIAVSDGIKQELQGYYLPESKITRIYLGINLNRFQASSSHHQAALMDLEIEPDELLIACVSQARPEKGLEFLLQALPKVKQAKPRVRLLLVGGGPLTEQLRQLAADLGVLDRVTFCGVRNDVETILNQSKLLVLPSMTEGLPLVMLESLACGKPVVASRVGGIPEVVTDGINGFLVQPRDIDGLADKIIKLMSDDDLRARMGKACLQKAIEFDVNIGVEQTLDLYKNLIDGNV